MIGNKSLLNAALATILAAQTVPAAGMAQEPTSPIVATHLRNNLHLLTTDFAAGVAGNVVVSVGDDGVFIVDDTTTELSGPMTEIINSLSGNLPIRFVVNTHWHFDHAGGNEAVATEGAVVVAHENTRHRLTEDQVIGGFFEQPASPHVALPVITFSRELTLHLNGDDIHVSHHRSAHTDGDAVIDFRNENVVHMGDIYMRGTYPFIDVGNGGSVDGVLRAVRKVAAGANSDTIIVPGHGAPSGVAELRDFGRMVRTVRRRVRTMLRHGKALEEIIAANPTAEFDDIYGGGFQDGAAFVATLVLDITRDRQLRVNKAEVLRQHVLHHGHKH